MYPFSRVLFLFAVVTLSSIHTFAFGGDFAKPSAKIERDPTGRIRLSIQFSRLSVADLTSLEIKPTDSSSLVNALIKYLDICVPSGSECGASSLKAKYVQNPSLDKTAPVDQDSNIEAEIEGSSVSFEKELNADTYILKADILLRSTDANAPFSSSTKVSTRIAYGNPSVTDNKTDISVTYSLGVAEALSDPYLVSSKKTLTAAWSKPSKVTLSDGSKGNPTSILAILIPQSAIDTQVTLPSRVYVDDFTKQSSEADSTCLLTSNPSNNSCSISCEAEDTKPQFLKSEDLASLAPLGILTEIVSNSLGNAISFTDLDTAQTYAIILQYNPDGTKRTCLLGQASDAITLIQLETGSEPKVGSSNCFIATAAFGSPLHSHLRSLRWFRDQYLLTHSFGRNLVKIYYEHSPKLATWLENKPVARAIVRSLLWLPIKLIEASESYQKSGLTSSQSEP